MPQVYLVRHGETEWNVQRRIQGQSDSPLTENGKHQARLLAHRLSLAGITHILTSDLGRAQHTAEIIATRCGNKIIKDQRLRELHMGVLEDRQLATLSEKEEQWQQQMVNGSPEARIPGGESMQEMATRMQEMLANCLEFPAESKLLLVSHGLALGCLLGTLLGLPANAARRLRLRNCSLSMIDYQQSAWLASGWVVETTGDTAHLDIPVFDQKK